MSPKKGDLYLQISRRKKILRIFLNKYQLNIVYFQFKQVTRLYVNFLYNLTKTIIMSCLRVTI